MIPKFHSIVPRDVQRRAFKISETAIALGITPVSVRRLIARGLLKPSRVLRHVLIPVEQIDALLKR